MRPWAFLEDLLYGAEVAIAGGGRPFGFLLVLSQPGLDMAGVDRRDGNGTPIFADTQEPGPIFLEAALGQFALLKVEVGGLLEGNVPIVPHFLEPLVGTGSEGLADQLGSGPGLVEVPGLEASQALRSGTIAIISIPSYLALTPLHRDTADVVMFGHKSPLST